jgi:hypothetical protein
LQGVTRGEVPHGEPQPDDTAGLITDKNRSMKGDMLAQNRIIDRLFGLVA